jgi:hypothetical protein
MAGGSDLLRSEFAGAAHERLQRVVEKTCLVTDSAIYAIELSTKLTGLSMIIV